MRTDLKSPHGWIFLDDDGWEHDPDPHHPHTRGEAEYATDFRPATEEEARSDQFFRAGVVVYSFGPLSTKAPSDETQPKE